MKQPSQAGNRLRIGAGIVLILWSLCSTTLAGGLKELDEKYGFRDLKFETPLSEINGLEPVAADPDEPFKKIFARPADDLMLGDARLDSISYVFYKERLYSVLILAKDPNCDGLFATLKEAYGRRPFQANQFMDQFYWGGKRATVLYTHEAIGDDCNVSFSSKPMTREKEADDKESAKKAKGDL